MKYVFKDGTEVDIERVLSVSEVRDLGMDKKSITLSKLGFSIHLSKRELVQITRNYHYSDWAKVKLELEKERQELLDKWKELSANK